MATYECSGLGFPVTAATACGCFVERSAFCNSKVRIMFLIHDYTQLVNKIVVMVGRCTWLLPPRKAMPSWFNDMVDVFHIMVILLPQWFVSWFCDMSYNRLLSEIVHSVGRCTLIVAVKCQCGMPWNHGLMTKSMLPTWYFHNKHWIFHWHAIHILNHFHVDLCNAISIIRFTDTHHHNHQKQDVHTTPTPPPHPFPHPRRWECQ